MFAYKNGSALGLHSCPSTPTSLKSWEQFGYSTCLKKDVYLGA